MKIIIMKRSKSESYLNLVTSERKWQLMYQKAIIIGFHHSLLIIIYLKLLYVKQEHHGWRKHGSLGDIFDAWGDAVCQCFLDTVDLEAPLVLLGTSNELGKRLLQPVEVLSMQWSFYRRASSRFLLLYMSYTRFRMKKRTDGVFHARFRRS